MRKLYPVLAAAVFALSIIAGGCTKEKSPPSPNLRGRRLREQRKNESPRVQWRLSSVSPTVSVLLDSVQ